MGINMGMNMGINMGNNMGIHMGIPYKFPINSLMWGLTYPISILGTSGDHLGNGFDEVIGVITTPALPECADRSV